MDYISKIPMCMLQIIIDKLDVNERALLSQCSKELNRKAGFTEREKQMVMYGMKLLKNKIGYIVEDNEQETRYYRSRWNVIKTKVLFDELNKTYDNYIKIIP